MIDARRLAPLAWMLALGLAPCAGSESAAPDAGRTGVGGGDDAGADAGDARGDGAGDGDADAPNGVDAPNDDARPSDGGADAAFADASDGGAGEGRAYDPCPSTGAACRVMPLGDSITDGCCGENTLSMGASYRLELFRLSLMHGKNITFVGSHASGPDRVDNVTFPKQQEGHPAWTIADGGGRQGLQQQIEGWLATTPPDIVMLMIGTNDVGIQLDLANAPKRLGVLIDTITKAVPKALVVVAQIVPTGTDDANVRVQALNAAMPALVETFAAAGKHVVLVDMYGAFTKDPAFKTKLLANDLHPADAGYAVMANVWWSAIDGLPAARH